MTTGLALDGQWTTGQSEFPSGDGDPGGDLLFSVIATPGDYDEDRQLTGADQALLEGAIDAGVFDARFDLNGDGLLNFRDLARFLQLLPSDSLPGDYNGNGALFLIQGKGW